MNRLQVSESKPTHAPHNHLKPKFTILGVVRVLRLELELVLMQTTNPYDTKANAAGGEVLRKGALQ